MRCIYCKRQRFRLLCSGMLHIPSRDSKGHALGGAAVICPGVRSWRPCAARSWTKCELPLPFGRQRTKNSTPLKGVMMRPLATTTSSRNGAASLQGDADFLVKASCRRQCGRCHIGRITRARAVPIAVPARRNQTAFQRLFVPGLVPGRTTSKPSMPPLDAAALRPRASTRFRSVRLVPRAWVALHRSPLAIASGAVCARSRLPRLAPCAYR